jgi:transcriptional regulator with XRE-family HTH domain
MSRLRKRFGIRLRQVRLSRKLTQEKLAEKLDISLNFLNMIERGERAPSFDTLERIARVLRTPVDEFFRNDPDNTPSRP